MQTVQSQIFAPGGVGLIQRWGFGLSRGDRLLTGIKEPPLGAHLVTPRFAYAHHGVYVGAGTVVHYGGFPCQWRRGPVEAISLKLFSHEHRVWVRPARS